MATLADRIREARQLKGMTQETLASLLGVARPTISQYETGRREPDNVTILRAIAEHLDVSLDWLVGGKEDSTAPLPDPDPDVQALFRSMRGLNDAEKQDIMDYVAWKRAQRRRKAQSEEAEGEPNPNP